MKRKTFFTALVALLLLSVGGVCAEFPIVKPAEEMVESVLIPQGGLTNKTVLDAMKRVPRHLFIDPQHKEQAYWDQAIAIGHAQTISPPYIVAYMTEQLQPKKTDKVLEIGTGSGYQAAVLGLLVKDVYTIEIVEPLGKQADERLRQLGFENIHVKIGDGYQGWKENAPFDSVIVTCSPSDIPQPLIDQLKDGGRMMIPVGEKYQQSFYLCTKVGGTLEKKQLVSTLFVPMTGEAQNQSSKNSAAEHSHTILINADFSNGTTGWHYVRNASVQNGTVCFTSKKPKKVDGHIIPGQIAQMLQGLALDGRHLNTLHLQYEIKGTNIAAWQGLAMTPTAVLSFFDADRNQIAMLALGRCCGTFKDKQIHEEIPIPPNSREAILLFGLPQASGELELKNVRLKAAESLSVPAQ